MLIYKTLILLVFAAAGMVPLGDDGGKNETTNEYQVKLALIEKFTQFIEWPKDSRVYQDNKPFYFGIYNDIQPFGEALIELKNSRQLKWKAVEVRFFEELSDFDTFYPDLLFVPKERSDQMESIAAALKDKPVLIIAEERDLVFKGAHLAIFLRDNNIRFKIESEAMTKQGFKVAQELTANSD